MMIRKLSKADRAASWLAIILIMILIWLLAVNSPVSCPNMFGGNDSVLSEIEAFHNTPWTDRDLKEDTLIAREHRKTLNAICPQVMRK